MTSSWTDARNATLTTLWARGDSASQIADEMGGITRSAVIGKVHRMGLPGRAERSNRNQIRRRPRQANANIVRRIMARQRPDVGQLPTPAEAPTPLNCTLVELAPNACHWPVNDGEPYRFCGHPAVNGFAYCGWHARIAYRPSRPQA